MCRLICDQHIPHCWESHVTAHWFIRTGCSKTCLKRSLKKDQKLGFKTDYCLMQVKSIAECSKGAFCNTFDLQQVVILSLSPLVCLFMNGCLRQVLLYTNLDLAPVWRPMPKITMPPKRATCIKGLFWPPMS